MSQGAPNAAVDAARFREQIRKRNWAVLKVAAFIGWVLEPPYWVLDTYMMPAHTSEATAIRLALFVLALALHMLSLREGGRWRKHDYAVSLILGTAFTWAMIGMTFLMGGYEADYFVGIMFVIIVMAFLFTWPLKVVITFNLLWLVPFFAPLFLGLQPIKDGPLAGSHFVFLLTTMFITALSQQFRYKLEEREFHASLDLRRTKADLEGALAQLKELDKAKSQFFNNVTHELRTPLTMVLSPLETLMQDDNLQRRRSTAEERYLRSMWQNGTAWRRCM